MNYSPSQYVVDSPSHTSQLYSKPAQTSYGQYEYMEQDMTNFSQTQLTQYPKVKQELPKLKLKLPPARSTSTISLASSVPVTDGNIESITATGNYEESNYEESELPETQATKDYFQPGQEIENSQDAMSTHSSSILDSQ